MIVIDLFSETDDGLVSVVNTNKNEVKTEKQEGKEKRVPLPLPTLQIVEIKI